jgi:hypothetical protein
VARDDRVRLEIAFDGGQTVAAEARPDSADGLQRALAAGSEAVFELETEDGSYLIPLRRVVYVKRESRETRIGFGVAP